MSVPPAAKPPAAQTYTLREAAVVLGVSDDTVRRWCDGGRLAAREADGRKVIDGAELAAFAVSYAAEPPEPEAVLAESARNRFPGIVTRVLTDTVMAQVDMQAGPHRIVSLMSREAVEELGLVPGSRAVASIKATHVVIESPRGARP